VLRGERNQDAPGSHDPVNVGSNPTPASISVTTSMDPRSNKIFCPECGGNNIERNGHRYLADGTDIQRWTCKGCAVRFSERRPLQKNSEEPLNMPSSIPQNGRLGALRGEKANKLAPQTETKTAAGEGEKQTQTPGIVLEFQWKMKKRNLADATIRNRGTVLKLLMSLGAELMSPESVETVLATEPYTRSMKYATVKAYKVFCRYYKIDWESIKTPYQPEEPFIPLEEEINCLIAACGKRTSAFCQATKDTGARFIEVLRLRWTDLNFKDNTISINRPAKGSNARTIEVPATTLNVLNNLPKIHGEHIFKQGGNGEGIKRSFRRTRRKLADKLQNPRLMKIHFHTLRHWRATMEYARTREIYAVKQLLGHKCLKNTDRYQHMVKFPHEEYISKVAKTVEEAQELLNAGFRFECDYGDEGKIFIRRK
jgi:integrase